MSDIPPINGPMRKADFLPAGVNSERGAPRGAPQVDQQVDRVEISDMAQMLSTLDPKTEVRMEKVAEIREAIANGTYETDDKIDQTVNRLLEVLLPRTAFEPSGG